MKKNKKNSAQPSAGGSPVKPSSPAPAPAAAPETPAAPAAPIPPLYRKIDWLAFAVTTLITFLGYLYTLAPDLTLEDCGELAVGSFYAGVPHPPGYPVWTIYSWLFTALVPISNVAYRVALSSAVAGALSCGLIALMVSRGSSMILEGVEMLRNLERRWENSICLAVGFVSGMLIGFNGYMWSQAVIVEVYTLSALSLAGVLCCLLRWVYAPSQNRYLYFAFFLFGICFTNHQTLITAAMGIEVLIIAIQPRLGRDFLMGNSIAFIVGLFVNKSLPSTNSNEALFQIFVIIGIASMLGFIILTVLTRRKASEWLALGRDICLMGALAYVGVILVTTSGFIPSYSLPMGLIHFMGAASFAGCAFLTLKCRNTGSSVPSSLWFVILGASILYVLCNMMVSSEPFKHVSSFWWYHGTGLLFLAALIFLATRTRRLGSEVWVPAVCGLMWILGAAFYFYMPLASMTNPPMNWGYPRTVEGFFHALTRGQYEQAHPTGTILRFLDQIWEVYTKGAIEEFTSIYLLIAVVPFIFVGKMQKRERAWVVGLGAIYACLAFLLLLLLNPAPDRQSLTLNRVFFTASHVMLAMFVGYGLALIAASLTLFYAEMRKYLVLTGVAALATTVAGISIHLAGRFTPAVGMVPLGIFSLALAVAIFKCVGDYPDFRKPILYGLAGTAVISLIGMIAFALADQYPVLPRVALVGGGALLIAFFLWALFNRELQLFIAAGLGLICGVVLVFTLREYNATAKPLVHATILFSVALASITLGLVFVFKTRFAHSLMLAILFVMPVWSILAHWSENEQRGHLFGYWFGHDMFKPPFGLYPDMARDAVLFGGTDPGRFAPTYMIFCQSFIPDSKKREPFDRRDVYLITQNALADGTYLNYIRAHYNRSTQPDPPFFQELLRLPRERGEGFYTNLLAQTVAPVDDYFLDLGARIEKRRRADGVYPKTEIHTPSPAEADIAFNAYIQDAIVRERQGRLKPGENLARKGDKYQVNGQVSVMAINGLLTSNIFMANPQHEFYVEESMPLDWMYPYLTPFGIIMKINRQQVPEMTQQIVDTDHKFWTQYSKRLVGDWVTYEMSIPDLVGRINRIYLEGDLTGYSGQRDFLRDDNAQKAFSKLRSAIGGLYSWRWENSTNPVEKARMLKEATFAYKQAFAFCPFSPEAVYRFSELLVRQGLFDDALLVARTCLKLDPFGQVNDLIRQIEDNRDMPVRRVFSTIQSNLEANNPAYAMGALKGFLNSPDTDPTSILRLADAFMRMGRNDLLEPCLQQLTKLMPENPEAWFDLARVQAAQGRQTESVNNLRRSLQLNDERLKKQSDAHNLRNEIKRSREFDILKNLPEFKSLVNP